MIERNGRLAPLWVATVLTLLGIVLIVIAVVYFAETADKLPSFFPGHTARRGGHHTKRGILAAVLGLLALIGAWMSARKRRAG